MNRYLLTLLIAITAFTASAQTEKGTFYIGGSISAFNTNSTSETYSYRNKQMYLMPTLGYFIASGWAIGLTPQYLYSKDSTSNNSGNSSLTKTKYLGIGADVRRYWSIIPKLSFYAQLSGNYLLSVGDAGADSKNYNVGASPNIAFFPTRYIALTLTYGIVGYTYQKDKYPDNASLNSVTTKAFNINLNRGAAIGFNYHF